MIEVLFYQNGDGKERVALKVVRANYRDLCGQYLPGEGRSWCKGGREFKGYHKPVWLEQSDQGSEVRR